MNGVLLAVLVCVSAACLVLAFVLSELKRLKEDRNNALAAIDRAYEERLRLEEWHRGEMEALAKLRREVASSLTSPKGDDL